MVKKVAVLGLAGNPSATHHRLMAEALVPHFDEIIVIPSGPRPDKPTVDDIDPLHRAVMVDMTFRGIPKVRIDLSDLEQATFTRTIDLEKRHRSGAETWIVVGADLIKGGKDDSSQIQRSWKGGEELWHSANFAVMARIGYELDPKDMPPHSKLFEPARTGASSEIRERAFKRLPVDGLVVPEVAAYMERYNLYRGSAPQRKTGLRLAKPRPLLVFDDRNDKAKVLAEKFAALSVADEANVIVAIGGDGHLLQTIRKHWRLRLPFLGINAGHRGYMLNDPEELVLPDMLGEDLTVLRMPLLHLEYLEVGAGGVLREDYAFNDVWVEKVRQTPWLEVKVNDDLWFRKFVGDGVLVSTPAGSTAYARNMGAMPLGLDESRLLLVGNNGDWAHHWKWATITMDSSVEIRPLDLQKRPVRLCYDDKIAGEVSRVRIRASRVASVELAYSPKCDLARKRSNDFKPPVT